MAIISRWLGQPTFSKTLQARLDEIPKFGASAEDTITIVKLLKRVNEFSRGEPEATRFYVLITRLTGLLETDVKDWQREGRSYDEVCTLLRQRYSRKPEEEWESLAQIRWEHYPVVEHFISAFKQKVEEIRLVGG